MHCIRAGSGGCGSATRIIVGVTLIVASHHPADRIRLIEIMRSLMPPLPIVATLLRRAAAEPERPCLIVDGQTYSYPTLAAAAAGWTTRLQSLGLARGDRVALALPNTPAFIAAYFGAQLAGAAVVLVNPQYRHAELSHLLADSEPAIVVATDENEALLREAMPATPPA